MLSVSSEFKLSNSIAGSDFMLEKGQRNGIKLTACAQPNLKFSLHPSQGHEIAMWKLLHAEIILSTMKSTNEISMQNSAKNKFKHQFVQMNKFKMLFINEMPQKN